MQFGFQRKKSFFEKSYSSKNLLKPIEIFCCSAVKSVENFFFNIKTVELGMKNDPTGNRNEKFFRDDELQMMDEKQLQKNRVINLN